jgi:hypothetical protein
MAHITKPCPECGGTESVRDTSTSICQQCKNLIAFAKQRQKDDAKKNGEEVLVRTKEKSYALPSYYVTVGESPHHSIRDRLQKALHAVIMAQARPAQYPYEAKDATDVPTIPKGDRSHDWVTYVYMRRDQALAMIELEEAMREYITTGAAASYENGRNLLLSIAGGKISMNELNEKHTKKS